MTYTERRAIIEQLLDHWDDYFEPATSGAITLREDPNKPMSKDWTVLSSMSRHPSVVELGRVLEVLREKLPNHFRHVKGWYGAEWRTTTAIVERIDAKGRKVKEPGRIRERVIPRWVEYRLVDRGLDVLLALWRVPDTRCVDCYDGSRWLFDAETGKRLCRHHVSLEVPPALRLKLREFTDQDGSHWTEAA